MKCMPCEKYAKADMPVRLSGALANVPYHLVRLLYYFGRAQELLFRYYQADETRPVSLTTDEMLEVK